MEIKWEVLGLLASVLINIIMGAYTLVSKAQTQKDKNQDVAVDDLKKRIEKLENQIDSKLDTIVNSLGELKTSMTVSVRDNQEAFERINTNFQKIESISIEINRLKERLGILESKQV